MTCLSADIGAELPPEQPISSELQTQNLLLLLSERAIDEDGINAFAQQLRRLLSDIEFREMATLISSNSLSNMCEHLAHFGDRYARVVLVFFGSDDAVTEVFFSDFRERIEELLPECARFEVYRVSPDGRHTPNLLEIPPGISDEQSLGHWAYLEDVLA